MVAVGVPRLVVVEYSHRLVAHVVAPVALDTFHVENDEASVLVGSVLVAAVVGNVVVDTDLAVVAAGSVVAGRDLGAVQDDHIAVHYYAYIVAAAYAEDVVVAPADEKILDLRTHVRWELRRRHHQ